MPKGTTAIENAKICAAVLRLAANGWDSVALEFVAKSAKILIVPFKQRFAAKHDLIPVVIEEIDREALAAVKTAGAPHDVLFDVLMARFDILQLNRAAILSIALAARHDPALSCAIARAALSSAQRIVGATKITSPPPQVLAVGLAAIHGWAFLTWRKDESRDMARTMAALDRALKFGGKAAALFN